MGRKAFGRMVAAGLLLGGLGLAAPATAQDDTPKLGRGLQNGILGWTEIVSRPQAEVTQRGPSGLVTGLLDGVALGTVRTVTGAAEVATFWSPLPVRYAPPVRENSSPLERRH